MNLNKCYKTFLKRQFVLVSDIPLCSFKRKRLRASQAELSKTKPWVALGQIEKSLGMKNYFTQDRFGQRKVDLRFRPLNLLNKFIISIS